MNPDMGVHEPAGRFPVGHAGAQTFGDRGRRRLRAGLQPRQAILRPRERPEQRMRVIGLDGRLTPLRRAAGRLGRFIILPGRPPPRFLVLVVATFHVPAVDF